MEDKMICPAEIIADSNRAPEFSVDSPYDENAVCFARKYIILRSSGSFTVMTAAVSAIMAVVSAILGYWLITITAGIIFLLMIFVISQIKPSAKRIYERLYKDEAFRRFSFYSDHFTVESVRGAIWFKYDKIKNVIFGEKYTLIFLPDGRSYIIDNGKIHDKELVMFIRNKVQKSR